MRIAVDYYKLKIRKKKKKKKSGLAAYIGDSEICLFFGLIFHYQYKTRIPLLVSTALPL